MTIADLTLRIGYASLIALALTLPFELERPLVNVGPLMISNIECLLGLTILATLLHGLVTIPIWTRSVVSPPKRPLLPFSWLLLLSLTVCACLLSAWLAPAFQTNALRAALRSLSGILLIPAVLILIPSRKAWWGVVVALVAGGLVAAGVGLLEVIAGYDFEWLLPWRSTPTVAGPFLRLAGPFDYANQAAMFIEATLPLLVGLGIQAVHSSRRMVWVALLVAFMLYTQAAILTFSRASIAVIVFSHLIVGGWSFLRRTAADKAFAWWWWGAASLMVILIMVNFLVSPIFRLRLQSQVDRDWYRATIDVPASFTMEADETVLVPVSITNNGSLTWYSSGTNEFNLGMRWQLANSDLELSRHPRWPLERSVAPGEALTIHVPLRAPVRGGEYRLVWDMVHENVTWFSAKNPTEASSSITVTGDTPVGSALADHQVPAIATTPLQFDAPIPGRRELWAVALRLIADYPLTGIGLDNYRLTYGRFFNVHLLPPGASWNNTIHTNNWYLETLVSLGVIGGLPYLAWLGVLVWDLWRTLGRIPPKQFALSRQRAWFETIHAGLAAVAISLLAYLLHGLLDYFMLFNATALLFWLLVALWLKGKQMILSNVLVPRVTYNDYANRI